MPATRESFVRAQRHRRAQLQIRAAYLSEFLLLWPLLNADDPDSVRRWLRLNISLIRRWRGPSHDVAVEFYADARVMDTGSRPSSTPRRRDLPEEQIIRNLVNRGPGVKRRARLVGLDEFEAEERALEAASGSGARMTLDAGRTAVDDAVKADRKAIGWMRVTDGDPCAWCAMLASRGAVYGSSELAGSVNKYHDHDGCSVAPVFTRDEFMSPEAMKFRAIWNDAGGNLKDFRRTLEGRTAAN